jgi:hypothetical protein
MVGENVGSGSGGSFRPVGRKSHDVKELCYVNWSVR